MPPQGVPLRLANDFLTNDDYGLSILSQFVHVSAFRRRFEWHRQHRLRGRGLRYEGRWASRFVEVLSWGREGVR